ncbi:MAG TPA: TonB-dependent receptor plug domain-containing protein, partial [Cellvibrio sp.]
MNNSKYTLIVMSALLGLAPMVMAEAEENTRQLSKVVVTGELLSRTVEESGTSVLVFEEETLSARPELRSVRDVLREIPNITDVTGTGKAPTVRGVDGTGPAENANAFFAGSRARLNWQIDGRSATYNEVVFGDIGIWDLQSIEVFRGPQSTLVGRNAIAGTILVRTNDPVMEQKSAVRIEGGNFEQKRVSLMHNQPLSESVSLRFAADGFERQSPVDYDEVEGVGNP